MKHSMNIKSINLEGFRNYRSFSAEFSDRVNVITGQNAQGKTNLLESVYYLTAGRSFRARGDRELIHFDMDAARITASTFRHDRDQKMEVSLFRAKRRQFFVNGVRLKTAAELSGKLGAVLFCPDDLNLIRDGAAARRRLMDMCLCQLRPRYAAALSEYNKLLEHKTRILRDHRVKPSLLLTLDDFDGRLASMGAQLIHYRSAYAALLAVKAGLTHKEFSGGTEELSIRYCTVKTVTEPRSKPEELLKPLLEHMHAHRQAELDAGVCLSGPHKDDLYIEINGKAARQFASQGQARTAALSIKLAERELHNEDKGEYPLLLLDDVLSELDAKRQSFVLNRISEGQVFITCCEDAEIASKTGGRVLHIENGAILT